MSFCFFKKTLSWETDLSINLGDFTVKKPRKIWKGNLCLAKKRDKVEMECDVPQKIIIICVTHVHFFYSNFN